MGAEGRAQCGIGATMVTGAFTTSIRYGQRFTDARIERSVGSKGNSYDNALVESVNALYKNEVINPEGPGRRKSH